MIMGCDYIPPCGEVGAHARFHAIVRSWLYFQCFGCFLAPVSGTVLPLEVFNMAAIRRSLLCFPMNAV